MDVSKRLRLEMERLKMTYRDLERATGISRSTLNRYAVGKPIPMDKVELIARALGLPPEELMGWTEKGEDMERLERIANNLPTDKLKTLITIAEALEGEEGS